MHIQLVAHAGAYLLIAASAAIGVAFAFSIGSTYHPAIGVILGTAALGGEILKPAAIAAAFDAARARMIGRALTAAALGMVCLVFSLAADLGLSATMRGDHAAERAAHAEQAAQRRATIERAERELAELAPARPAAELRALAAVEREKPGANNCTKIDGPISRAICPRVAALEAEASRFDRRMQLEAQLAELHSVQAPAVGAPDPLAAALATYAAAAGIEIRPERISPWLALLLPLFVELGSAFGLVVARSVGATPPAPAGDDDDAAELAPIVDKLRSIAANGIVSGTQRQIAEQIGEPLVKLNRALKAGAARRLLSLDTTGNRTQIRLTC